MNDSNSTNGEEQEVRSAEEFSEQKEPLSETSTENSEPVVPEQTTDTAAHDPQATPEVTPAPEPVKNEDSVGSQEDNQNLTATLLDEIRDEIKEISSSQSSTIGQLQETISSLRRNQLALLLRPSASKLVEMAVKLHDSAGKDYSQVDAAELQKRVADEFSFYEEAVLDALSALGFEKIEVNVGDVFDRQAHKAVKTVETDLEENDGKIAAVQNPAFKYAGESKVSFPAKVQVFKYTS